MPNAMCVLAPGEFSPLIVFLMDCNDEHLQKRCTLSMGVEALSQLRTIKQGQMAVMCDVPELLPITG